MDMIVKFYLNKDKKSNSIERSIYCYVRGFGENKTIVLNTKERINEKYWDVTRQNVKKSYVGSLELNNYLDKFKSEVNSIIRNLKSENMDASFETIQDALYAKFKNNYKNLNSVVDMLEEYKKIKESTGEVGVNRLKMITALIVKLRTYEAKYKIILTFSNLKKVFFDNFITWQIENGFENSTTASYISILKTFIRWSIERGVKYDFDLTKIIRGHSKENFVVSCDESELEKLTALDGLTDAQQVIRDSFIFSCHTGLRFSDIRQVKKDNLTSCDGRPSLSIITQKTDDALNVPLSSRTMDILNKYPNGFRMFTLVYTNIILKELFRKAGIDSPVRNKKQVGNNKTEEVSKKCDVVSFHVGRKTFCTLLANKEVSAEVIMAMTGHKNHKTFEKYFTIKNEAKRKAVELLPK